MSGITLSPKSSVKPITQLHIRHDPYLALIEYVNRKKCLHVISEYSHVISFNSFHASTHFIRQMYEARMPKYSSPYILRWSFFCNPFDFAPEHLQNDYVDSISSQCESSSCFTAKSFRCIFKQCTSSLFSNAFLYKL